jgi:hypothetical protein
VHVFREKSRLQMAILNFLVKKKNSLQLNWCVKQLEW